MKRRTEKVAYWFCGIPLLAGATLFFLWAYSRYEAARASTFIATLNELHIGAATESFVPTFLKLGGKRVSGPAQFSTHSPVVDNSGSEHAEQWAIYFGMPYNLNVFLSAHPRLNSLLGFFAIHPWMVEAWVTTEESKTTNIYYLTVIQLPSDAKVMSIVNIEDSASFGPGRAKYRVSLSSLRNKIPYLECHISGELSLQERSKLTAYSLNCLNTRKGCQASADIAPGLWNAYSLQSVDGDRWNVF